MIVTSGNTSPRTKATPPQVGQKWRWIFWPLSPCFVYVVYLPLIFTELVGTLMAWQAYPWLPGRKFSTRVLRELSGYSVTMTYTQVLYVALVRVQDVIIGRFIGTAAVGQYRTAWRTVELISQGVILPFTQVALPTLGRLQDDLPAFRKAYLRITAARASREHPELLTMLADGRLHLSGIAKLAPHLTPANRDELLRRATHRSKRQIEVLLAEVAPRPDVPVVLRRLPEPLKTGMAGAEPPAAVSASPPPLPDVVTPVPTNPLRPDGARTPPTKLSRVEPLSPGRYQLQLTVSAALVLLGAGGA